MRTRLRFAFGFMICIACAGGSIAIAQPRRGGRQPSPPPSASAAAVPVDAGAPITDAASLPEPVRTDWDASAKLSPLTPAPNEFAGATPEGGAPPPDYDKIIADVAALRARVASLSDGLFRSKIAVEIETDGDHSKFTRLTVSVDDGVVWTAPPGFHSDDYAAVFEHSIAPGKHTITVEAERADAKDESFKTSDRTRFTVDVPKDQRLDVQVRVGDDSSMGADFPADRKGKYDLRFRVKAVAK